MIRRDSIDEMPALAPSPTGVDVCSCDEALELRRELGAARALLDQVGDARQRAVENAWHLGGPGHD